MCIRDSLQTLYLAGAMGGVKYRNFHARHILVTCQCSLSGIAGSSHQNIGQLTAAQNQMCIRDRLETAVIQKKTKRGHKEIDLKQALPRIETEQKENELQAELLLTAGEGNNLNPSLWLNFMQEHCGLNPADVSVLRTALLLEDQTDFR